MAAKFFYVPQTNLLGAGCLNEVRPQISVLGLKKALVVSDKVLAGQGIVKKVTDQLDKNGIGFVVHDETTPNPTCVQV